MQQEGSGLVQHEQVDANYLERRKLKRSAGWILLWALGVGAVISGDYAGWNNGLAHGGFWGLAIATLLMGTMYFCMIFSIAELSAALPHAGGFASFTRNAMGPFGAFICGVTNTIEYIVTPAVIVFYIGGYMEKLIPGIPDYVWWLCYYGVFVGINIYGVALTLRVSLVMTLIAVIVLAIFYISSFATGSFHIANLFDVAADPGQSAHWLPKGWHGVFVSLPFAIWFFLAVEELPLAAEEAHDVVNDVPKALIWGIVTLMILALLTLVTNTGVSGAEKMGKSTAALADGFSDIFGVGTATILLTLVALTGLIASFHSIIYAYGRILFALSRAGYLPRWISVTNRNHTPYISLIVGGVIGFGCTLSVKLFGGEGEELGVVGATLINMAVFGAVIAYVMVMVSYIKLRFSRPDLPRPYKSPLGIPGAALGAVLALAALAATFSSEAYRPAVISVAVFVAVAIAYFLLYSRHHLVAQAPEEEAALIAAAQMELAQAPID
jgi:ethanolamine permease